MKILALDLSLTSTGVADDTGTRTIKTDLRGAERLDYLGRMVMDQVIGPFENYSTDVTDWHHQRPDLVAIEGPSYASAQQAHHLGELGGVVRRDLFVASVPYIEVAPATIKIAACGAGNAPKVEVLTAAIRRLGYAGNSNDEADALWLWALVKAAVGEPVVTLPATHARAIATVAKLLPTAVAS